MVTGGGRGIGRAIAERLLGSDDIVAVIDRDEESLRGISGHRQRAAHRHVGDNSHAVAHFEPLDTVQLAQRTRSARRQQRRGRQLERRPVVMPLEFDNEERARVPSNW